MSRSSKCVESHLSTPLGLELGTFRLVALKDNWRDTMPFCLLKYATTVDLSNINTIEWTVKQSWKTGIATRTTFISKMLLCKLVFCVHLLLTFADVLQPVCDMSVNRKRDKGGDRTGTSTSKLSWSNHYPKLS